MIRTTITTCAALLLAVCLRAQMPDSATQMKNWMDYMTPGKEHAMMAKWDGTWSGNVQLWMAPGTEAMVSTGTTTNTMVLGGRYQESVTVGSAMGQPLEGRSTLAYDKVKKMFISTWIDNMGSGMMISMGKWNDVTKSITFTGRMVDPAMAKEVPFREVLKIIDDDHQVMEMYVLDAKGKEFKTMQIDYTRQK